MFFSESKGLEGNTLDFGMLFRVNGAAVFSKGANVIPMDEFEGRMTADAHTIMVESAVASGMNTLRKTKILLSRFAPLCLANTKKYHLQGYGAAAYFSRQPSTMPAIASG